MARVIKVFGNDRACLPLEAMQMQSSAEPGNAAPDSDAAGGASSRGYVRLKGKQWDSDAAHHVGNQSSMLPPISERRATSLRAAGASGSRGMGKFKRAGWAAMDEPPPREQPAKKRPSGKRKTAAEREAMALAAAEAAG